MKKKKNSSMSLVMKIILSVIGLITIIIMCLLSIQWSVSQGGLPGYPSTLDSAISEVELTPEVSSHNDPYGIQDAAQIELPPSYSDLRASCGGFQGWIAYTSFEIYPDELDQFLATTDIQQPLLMTLPDDIKSFYFENLDVFPDATLYGVSDRYEWLEEIIVDTTNSERWVVYFTVLAG